MKPILLTEKEYEKLLDTLAYAQDEGPAPNGWKSEELRELIKTIENHDEAFKRFKQGILMATIYEDIKNDSGDICSTQKKKL